MSDVWKGIKGYEGLYQISNKGKVRSLSRVVESTGGWRGGDLELKQRLLKFRKNKGGYFCVKLSKNGGFVNLLVSRIVAENFISNPEHKRTVNHIDSNRTNNNVENLEWCTQKENVAHSWRKGLTKPKKGVAHGMAKLNEKQVRVIKHMKNIPNHISQQRIGKIFGVTQEIISEIWCNKIWKHITI